MVNKRTVKFTVFSMALLFFLLGLSIYLFTGNINSFLIGLIGFGVLISLYRLFLWFFKYKEKPVCILSNKKLGGHEKFNPAQVQITTGNIVAKKQSFLENNTDHHRLTLYCEECGLFMNTQREVSMPPEWLSREQKKYIDTPSLLVCICPNCQRITRHVS